MIVSPTGVFDSTDSVSKAPAANEGVAISIDHPVNARKNISLKATVLSTSSW
jgi:hypothetical protein